MLSSSERWAREVKHVQKFRDTNLLYCFAFFFFFFKFGNCNSMCVQSHGKSLMKPDFSLPRIPILRVF